IATRSARERSNYGSANTKMLLPRLKSSWLLPAAATAMYCLPSTMYDVGGEFTPAPHWNDHSFLPLAASYALKFPLPSPVNTRLPAVASAPPIKGCWVSAFQASLPVSRLTAASLPHCFSLGMTLNAPPSHSLPPG